MARRFEVSDEQWEKLAPYFGNKQGKMGRPQADNRKLFNGVLWVLRTGAPWRDLPDYYGPWQTVYKRFAQWQENDTLKNFFESLREGADMQDLCIDGTYIKAHRASAGAKKGMWTVPADSVLVLVVEDAIHQNPRSRRRLGKPSCPYADGRRGTRQRYDATGT